MAQTPEGKVKSSVKKLLDPHRPNLYYEMPVPSGFGKSGLDFWGSYMGRAFAIETKAPGKKPSLRQEGTIEDMRAAGIKVFTVIGDIGLLELRLWLEHMERIETLQ